MNTKTNRKPIQVKRGNVTVKIYQGNNRVNGTVYPQFTLTYYEGNQRRKKRFADLAEARREAEFTAEKLSRGEGQVLHLTSADRTVYLQVLENLRPLNVPLNVAVLEYVSAIKQLPPGSTLKEAVDFFRKRNPASLEKRTVRQAADEMLAAKRGANLSAVHLKDLDYRLNRLAGAFQMNIGGVSGSLLQTWLDNMKGSGRTKRNYLAVVAALFRFCIRQKYLPKHAMEEVEAVQQTREDNGEIEIFTPAEMNEMLSAGGAELAALQQKAGIIHAAILTPSAGRVRPNLRPVAKLRPKFGQKTDQLFPIIAAGFHLEPQPRAPPIPAGGQCRAQRELLPVEGMNQHGRFPTRRPSAPDGRSLGKPAFVFKANPGVAPARVFFTAGHRWATHCRIARSGRSFARRAGRCSVHSIARSTRQTWPG